MSKTDEELIDDFISGHEDSFIDLVKRYQNKTFNLSYRLVGNKEDAADLCQEIFIHLLSKISLFQEKSTFSTWFYRLAVNKIYDFLRRKKEIPLQDEELLYFDKTLNKNNDPSVTYEKIELQAKIQSELNKLDHDFRVIIVLREIYDLSYQQISEVLNISIGTVKSRLNRARQALAKNIMKNNGNKI